MCSFYAVKHTLGWKTYTKSEQGPNFLPSWFGHFMHVQVVSYIEVGGTD